MPVCSVLICKNRSDKQTYKTCGITYHCFPVDPKTKEEWIAAVGRSKEWFPTKTSTVCSAHFKESDFQITKKSRRLFPWAVPTLKIRLVFKEHVISLSLPSTSFVVDSQNLNEATNIRSPDPAKEDNISSSQTISHIDNGCDSTTTKTNQFTDLKNILADVEETPRKKKLKLLLEKTKNMIKYQKCKIKRLQTTTRRYKKKILIMEDLLGDLKKNRYIDANHYSLLSNTNAGVQDLIARTTLKTQTGCIVKTKYSPALRSFALTLHFYSPKAYFYVRQKFETCLPHPRTIKKWYQSIDASPGFTIEALNALKAKANIAGYPLICNLVMDEMAIGKRVEWDGHKMHGLVDFGNVMTEGDHMEEAKQALVFLLTAINGAFKVPVGFFLVNGVTAEQRACLVRQCLEFLHPTGIEITSLTFDGCPSNVSMARELGGAFEYPNMKTDFEHPVTKKPVYFFFDPCHMLKLVRNAFQVNGSFINGDDQLIKWSYLESLNEKQEREHLHLANKLRRKHIFYHNQKMKVRLASQLFSNSVADALLFCSELLIADFQGVEATVDFLKIINDLFDILCSRNMQQLNFKKPMYAKNKVNVFHALDKAENFLKSLKLSNGRLVIHSTRKIGFIGFIVCIHNIKKMYVALVERERKLVYLPAYKISQDHLELMFGNIRAHGGCNTNPTARQFQAIYKKLLVKSELRDFESGNCKALETVALLNCSSSEKINSSTEKLSLYEEGNDNETGENDHILEQSLHDEEIDVMVRDLSEFNLQAVTYIAGFVVHALLKKIKCDLCISGLLADALNSNHRFIKLKDKGGLIFPSDDVINICKKMEIVIKETLLKEEKIKSIDIIKNKLVPKALNYFIGMKIFKCIDFHQYDQSPMSNHLIHLTKAVMEKYIDVRLHHILKPQILSKRHVLSKYLHFTGQ